MKIVDSFMFGLEYELDILEWRLEYLNNFVSNFVIVEALFDQLGNPKPAYFLENKMRYKDYLNKVVHVLLKLPATHVRGSWENENYQRNSITKGLEKISLEPSDLVLISDLDEFPNIRAVEFYIENQIQHPVSLTQDRKRDLIYDHLPLKLD